MMNQILQNKNIARLNICNILHYEIHKFQHQLSIFILILLIIISK
jgi:hypothetical protein